MVFVFIRCVLPQSRYVMNLALFFLIFVFGVWEAGDRTELKAVKREYFIEAEIVKILPDERHIDGTMAPGSDISVYYPIEGRDTTSEYESVYYLTQEQYDNAQVGKKVRISVKEKCMKNT